MQSVIDTNVFIFDAVEDSLYHSQAEEILDELKTWLIPTIVLFEFIFALNKQGVKARVIRELLMQYVMDPRARIVKLSVNDIISGLDTIISENKTSTHINDKTILQIAIRLKAPLSTFDKKLRRQARKFGVMVLPEEI